MGYSEARQGRQIRAGHNVSTIEQRYYQAGYEAGMRSGEEE
jgi:hypothetical protein